ncbi:MAG: TRAP transporter large permease subunit [Myxococcota bacterium]|nr:TRAP transporter large permease subunit [Myxococcota bacterium]
MMFVLIALVVFLVIAGGFFLKTKPVALGVLVGIALFPLLFGSVNGAVVSATVAVSIMMAQPLFSLLGMVTVLCMLYLSDIPPDDFGIFPEKIFELTDKAVLLAIPFFVVSGAIMTKGGIAKRLISLATALTDWIPGGLAIAAIGGCVLFAAISGSSPVTVIAIGGMMYPALVKAGFDEDHAMGLLTSAGSLGIVIPPSIPMIIYAITVSGVQVVDIGELFLAGLGPGALIGFLLSTMVVFKALQQSTDKNAELKRLFTGLAIIAAPIVVTVLLVSNDMKWGYAVAPISYAVMTFIKARKELIEGFWALMLPILILGGIYSGFFTPTEAAAVAVVYAWVAAAYIHKELTVKDLPALITESTLMMGALIVIMVIAFVFNDYLVEEQIPELAVDVIRDMELSRIGFLAALNVFLLIVGCFMDIISAILIIAPLIVPIAVALDIDAIHLGIVFIVNLEIGYLTPPLGLNLFVATTLFGKPLGDVIRAVLPFTLAILVGVLMITYIPAIALAPGEILKDMRGETTEESNVQSIQEIMKSLEEKDAIDAAASEVPAAESPESDVEGASDEAEEPTEGGDSGDSPDTASPEAAPDTEVAPTQ